MFQEYLRALIPMNTQLMVKPSSLMPQGLKMVEFGNIYLFRFTDDLQSRMEELLERKKLDLLTADEIPELAGIIELSRIFTLINAQLSTQAKWCPIALDNLYDNELSAREEDTAVPFPYPINCRDTALPYPDYTCRNKMAENSAITRKSSLKLLIIANKLTISHC